MPSIVDTTDACNLNVYYNGVKFGEYTAGVRATHPRQSSHSVFARIRHGIVHAFVHESIHAHNYSSPANELSCAVGHNIIRGYFAKSNANALPMSEQDDTITDSEPTGYDLFVGFIASRMTLDPPARVYRVVWADEITILGIYREATDADRTAAKMGRSCPGVESAAKNTDVFRIVNGVRITVII